MKLVMSLSRISTATTSEKGTDYNPISCCVFLLSVVISILEYLTRDDAERAVKELDNRDLRGQSVRVNLDAEVSRSLITEVYTHPRRIPARWPRQLSTRRAS